MKKRTREELEKMTPQELADYAITIFILLDFTPELMSVVISSLISRALDHNHKEDVSGNKEAPKEISGSD